MEKMEILCPNYIAIEVFRKGIKRITSLFIELTKTTPSSLDMVYKKVQKFVNVERELKLKTLMLRSSDKSITSKDSGKENYLLIDALTHPISNK